jgi:hypothetical protein
MGKKQGTTLVSLGTVEKKTEGDFILNLES